MYSSCCKWLCDLGSSDGKIHCWNTETGAKVVVLNGEHTGPVQSVQFNPKFMMLASACTNMVCSCFYFVHLHLAAFLPSFFVTTSYLYVLCHLGAVKVHKNFAIPCRGFGSCIIQKWWECVWWPSKQTDFFLCFFCVLYELCLIVFSFAFTACWPGTKEGNSACIKSHTINPERFLGEIFVVNI